MLPRARASKKKNRWLSRNSPSPSSSPSPSPSPSSSSQIYSSPTNASDRSRFPPRHSLRSSATPPPDVSYLLNGNAKLIPDLEIIHYASNTTFSLHKSVLNQSIKAETDNEAERSSVLSLLIPSSPLPASTIRAFFQHLYFHSLSTDCDELIGMTWFAGNAIPFESTARRLLSTLADRLSAADTLDMCNAIIRAWLAYIHLLNEDHPLVQVLLSSARREVTTLQRAINQAICASDPQTLAITTQQLTTLLIKVMQAEKSDLEPQIGHSLDFLDRQWLSAEDIDWSASPDASRLQAYSTNFCFVHESGKSIVACGWLLYAHWPWFKNLIDSGLQESKTRIVRLPANSLTFRALKLLLNAFLSQDAIMEDLEDVDLVSILKHAELFQLCSSSQDEIAAIRYIVNACSEVLFPPLSESNCWRQMRLAYDIKSDPYYGIILTYIAETRHIVDLREMDQLPMDLISEIFLKRRQALLQ